MKLLTTEQAAKYLTDRGLECNPRQVRLWIKAGALKGTRWQRHYLVSSLELDRLLQRLISDDDRGE